MFPSFSRLPESIALCCASLCAGLVLLLQYAPSCAQWTEEHELNTCVPIRASIDFLCGVSESVHFPALNRAETALADSASDILASAFAEYNPQSLPTDLPELPPSLPENSTAQTPTPEPQIASDTPPVEEPPPPSPVTQPALPQPAAPTSPCGTSTPEPQIASDTPPAEEPPPSPATQPALPQPAAPTSPCGTPTPEPQIASDTPPVEEPPPPSPVTQPALPQPAAPTSPNDTPTPEPSPSVINQKSVRPSLLLRSHSPRASLFDFANGKISLNAAHIILYQQSTTENSRSIPLPFPPPNCSAPHPFLTDSATENVRRNESTDISGQQSTAGNQPCGSEANSVSEPRIPSATRKYFQFYPPHSVLSVKQRPDTPSFLSFVDQNSVRTPIRSLLFPPLNSGVPHPFLPDSATKNVRRNESTDISGQQSTAGNRPCGSEADSAAEPRIPSATRKYFQFYQPHSVLPVKQRPHTPTFLSFADQNSVRTPIRSLLFPPPNSGVPHPFLPDSATKNVRRNESTAIPGQQSTAGNQPCGNEASSATERQIKDCGPMRCRILMVGDSLMEDLGPVTHRAMRQRKGLEFIVSAKFSTGLCRPDYFNWPEHLTEVVEHYHPDIVIFFLGANDGTPVRVGKRAVPTGGEAWQAAYGDKMAEVINIARQSGADVIWVELPAMGGKYSKVLRETQIAQCSYCENNGIPILHSDLAFSGEWGIFEPYGDFNGSRTRLRRQDLVHLTKEGNQKLLGLLMPLLEQHLCAFYVSHPERHLSPEEVKQIRNVPAVYTCQPGYSRSKKPKSPQ